MSFFSKQKKTVSLFLFASLLMLVFLGLTAMTHEQNGQMQGGCPFSTFGASLCPQDMVAVALHQISSYQALFSVPTQFATMIFAAVLLFALLVALALIVSRSLPTPASFVFVRGAPPYIASYRKITQWLSLFENSPSL